MWDYLPNDIDAEKKIRKKEIDRHLEITTKVHDSKQFYKRARTTGPFNSTRHAYGPPETLQEIKERPKRAPSMAEHERAFRPN